MAKAKDWISAARPRTLPLALAGLALGNLLSANQATFIPMVALMSILTATFLQVLSNFANDYGDYVNGADNEQRIGPARAVQSGAITAKQMKNAIIITSVLSLASGIILLYMASKNVDILWLLTMLGFGLLSIGAAYKYTASKNPYGYKGFGDIAVFVFFGLLAVIGSYFLQTGKVDLYIVFPACAFGFLSTGVLNLNNMRDIENDQKSGKITIAVRLGIAKAKQYHYALIGLAVIFLLLFSTLMFKEWYQFIFLAPLILLLQHVSKVKKRSSYEEFNPLLKELSLKSALVALSFGFGYII